MRMVGYLNCQVAFIRISDFRNVHTGLSLNLKTIVYNVGNYYVLTEKGMIFTNNGKEWKKKGIVESIIS